MSNNLHDKVEQRFQSVVERLSAKGRRITPQRLAILRMLISSKDHPSAEQIHLGILKEFPTTSLATVYKTITMLKEEGEVIELEFSEASNRYDGMKPEPHPHVVCSKCGVIVDPETVNLQELMHRIASETGFVLHGHRLDFFGLCPKCRE